jgi:hypothetical protein
MEYMKQLFSGIGQQAAWGYFNKVQYSLKQVNIIQTLNNIAFMMPIIE